MMRAVLSAVGIALLLTACGVAKTCWPPPQGATVFPALTQELRQKQMEEYQQCLRNGGFDADSEYGRMIRGVSFL